MQKGVVLNQKEVAHTLVWLDQLNAMIDLWNGRTSFPFPKGKKKEDLLKLIDGFRDSLIGDDENKINNKFNYLGKEYVQ